MRFERPSILAIAVAIIFGTLAGASILIFYWYNGLPADWGFILLLVLIFAVLSYISVRYAVEQFIYRKVKIIYKNIHNLKVSSKRDEKKMLRRSQSDFERVTAEVSEWAEQRQMEIDELVEREAFRREFMGNISHELKTPIFNIQGYLLTLLDGALDDPEINRKYLKRANKSVDRMINIIEDLEIISNLETNRVQLSYSSFDMVMLVREVFELLDNKSRDRNITLKLKKDYEKPIRVSADRPKIEQVLVNLVSNAIKYGKKGGAVEVRFYDMHNQVLIEVADDGIGIPQEDIPRVFERFYRVDKSRSREAGGTGLGLAIVKHIMEAHKQAINVRSSENAGSTFSFTLQKS